MPLDLKIINPDYFSNYEAQLKVDVENRFAALKKQIMDSIPQKRMESILSLR